MTRHLFIVASASLALCSFSAYAHDAPTPNTQSHVNCSRLPISQRGICGIEHPAGSAAAATAAPTSQQQQATDARYARAIAQCKRMPVSERNTCIDDASLKADREAASHG